MPRAFVRLVNVSNVVSKYTCLARHQSVILLA
jgi:hypothetical protein